MENVDTFSEKTALLGHVKGDEEEKPSSSPRLSGERHYQATQNTSQRGQDAPGDSEHHQQQTPEDLRTASNARETDRRDNAGNEENQSETTTQPVAVSPEGSKNYEDSGVASNQKTRMFVLALVTFMMSCAGKFHSPLMTQYIYQMYTESVYGNASVGVEVSKQPCVNDTSNSSNDPLRDEVQDKSADLYMRLDLVSGGIAIVTNLFLGAYSDVLGRRFVLLVPVLGHFLRNTSAPIIIYWDLGLPALYSGYVLDGLCGGSAGPKFPYFNLHLLIVVETGILLGFYVYAADITRGDKQRTLGMAIVEAGIGLADAATEFAAGLIIEDTGFLYVSLLASGLLLVCLVIILCGLPETVPRDRKRLISPLEGVKRMCKVFVARDHPYQAALLLLGLLAFFMVDFPAYSTSKIKSLILMNQPFCWSSLHLGILGSVESGGSHVISLGLIKILQKALPTPVLAMIGATSMAVGELLMGLATTDLMVYIRAGVLLASTMLTPSIRSLMSRMVPPDKQGAMFAGLAVVSSVCKCLSQMALMPVYQATLSITRGMVNFLVAGVYLSINIIYLVYMYLLRKQLQIQATTLHVQTEGTRRRS